MDQGYGNLAWECVCAWMTRDLWKSNSYLWVEGACQLTWKIWFTGLRAAKGCRLVQAEGSWLVPEACGAPWRVMRLPPRRDSDVHADLQTKAARAAGQAAGGQARRRWGRWGGWGRSIGQVDRAKRFIHLRLGFLKRSHVQPGFTCSSLNLGLQQQQKKRTKL